jgi:pseudouridine-5'-phosphate glycosidase
VANRDDVVKVSVRDIATLVARGGSGATTVAATSHLASMAGIRVFATGGLGGVHRQARDSWDESADLNTLAVTRMTVVCSGVKSILDVGATLERLRPQCRVLGYATNRFPGFTSPTRFPAHWSADDAAAVADIMRVRDVLRIPRARGGNPLPESEQLIRHPRPGA